MKKKVNPPHIAQMMKIYSERGERNRRYSMRSFARDIEISPSFLSKIFNGQKGVSLSKGRRIAKKLKLNHKETQAFLLSILSEHGRSTNIRKRANEELDQLFVSDKDSSADGDWASSAVVFEAVLNLSPSDAEAAKEEIKKFQKKFTKHFSSDGGEGHLYQLTVTFSKLK